MAGLLGCQCTLSGHVQFLINQHPQVLLGRAAFNPFIPQPVLIAGVDPKVLTKCDRGWEGENH